MELFDEHKDIARAEASRRSSREARRLGIEFDDLENAGLVAIWRAAHRYDASKGTKFVTLLWKRVRGTMLDRIRMARGRRNRQPLLIPFDFDTIEGTHG